MTSWQVRSNSNTPNSRILRSGQTTLLCVRMWESVRLYISFAGSSWHDDLVSVTILSRIKLDPLAVISLKSIGLDCSNPVLSMDCSPPSFRTTCNLYQGISKVKYKKYTTYTSKANNHLFREAEAAVSRYCVTYEYKLHVYAMRDYSWVGPGQLQTINWLRCALIHSLHNFVIL